MSLHKVFLDEHLGKGFKKDPDRKKVDVDLTDFVDGKTVKYEKGKLSIDTPASGLDCAAIDALPIVTMDKSVRVLGKKGDQCVQIAVLDSIFQDVGVGISANRYSVFTGEKFNVKVTVTNTGEGTNEQTTLSIIKPQSGNFSMTNQTHQSSGVNEVVQNSETSYTLKGIEPGGSVVVSFDVESAEHGTYQFSASVDPDSALDINPANQYATITLSVATKADPTYLATEDCPAISVVDDTSKKELGLVNVGRDHPNVLTSINFFAREPGERTYTLSGASTVVVATTTGAGFPGGAWCTKGIDGEFTRVSTTGRNSDISPTTENPFTTTDVFTVPAQFNAQNGKLSFSTLPGHITYIAMRPAGSTCRWQYVVVTDLATAKNPACNIEVDGDELAVTRSSTQYYRDQVVNATTVVARTLDTDEPVYKVPGDISIRANESGAVDLSYTKSVTIHVKKGTRQEFNVTSDCNWIKNTHASGRVTMEPKEQALRITVSEDATATDSVRVNNVTVKIVD